MKLDLNFILRINSFSEVLSTGYDNSEIIPERIV